LKRWLFSAAFVVVLVFAFGMAYLALYRDVAKERCQELGLPFPTVMAHRGASYLAPEETEWAYRLARAAGADFLEADVQRSKDGVLFVLHDDTLERTTNVKTVFPGREKEPVSTFFWEELSRLDAGSWWNQRHPERAKQEFANARLLRVEELVDLALESNPPTGIYLETKSPEHFPDIETDLVKLLSRRGYGAPSRRPELRGKLVFQSFSADSLRKFATLTKDIPRIYLLDEDMVQKQGFGRLLSIAKEVGHGIGPVGYFAYPWHTHRAHAQGLVVHAWTLNQGWQLRLLRFFGIDGAFTDRSELAVPLWGRGKTQSQDELWQKALASRKDTDYSAKKP
jgi:glycerophosphoryl diester phosphodiesterase